MKSYSQYGEDRIIWEIFGGDGGIKGNLLDIGAWGVCDLSNSRGFVEMGWAAVLCEFSPKPVRELVQEYGYEGSRVQIVAAAVVPIHQHCVKFKITDNALSAVPGSSTAIAWRDAGGYFGDLFVPTVPLKDILNQFFSDRDLDYVSIDTEGTSVDLLLELWALGRRPRAIVCEHDGRDTQIWEAAKLAGYAVRDRNETNIILERTQ